MPQPAGDAQVLEHRSNHCKPEDAAGEIFLEAATELGSQASLNWTEAGSCRIHPESTAGKKEGDAEHIGLHCRQADIKEGLLQIRAIGGTHESS